MVIQIYNFNPEMKSPRCAILQRECLPCQYLTQTPELGPVVGIPEVGVQFVIGDRVLIEVGSIIA